jgi:hypothetical protein
VKEELMRQWTDEEQADERKDWMKEGLTRGRTE